MGDENQVAQAAEPDEQGGSPEPAGRPEPTRQPATPEEERALEQEELESFRRRKRWQEEVLGDGDTADRDGGAAE